MIFNVFKKDLECLPDRPLKIPTCPVPLQLEEERVAEDLSVEGAALDEEAVPHVTKQVVNNDCLMSML
jgi:hypothetical protein